MTPDLLHLGPRLRSCGHRAAVRTVVSGVTVGAVVLGLLPFAAPAAAQENTVALPEICVEEPEVDQSPSPSVSPLASASPSDSSSPSGSPSPSVEVSSSSPASDDGDDESASEPSVDEADPPSVGVDESDSGDEPVVEGGDAGEVITSATVTDAEVKQASVCPPPVGGLRATAGLGRVQLAWEFAFLTEVSESVVGRAGELPVDAGGDSSAAGESESESVAPSDGAGGDGDGEAGGGESSGGEDVDPSPSASVSPSLDVSASPSPSPSGTSSPSPSASPSASVSPSASASPSPSASPRPVRSAPPVERFVVVVSPGDRVIEVSSGERSAVVSGLRNGTQYSFTVFAVSELGRGPGETVSATPVTGMEGEVAGVLVKFTGTVTDAGSVPGADRVDVVDLQLDREVADDVHLVEFSDAVDAVTAEQIADQLQADPGVEWAEPDQFVFISQTDTEPRAPPDDPLFANQQWNLWGDYGVGLAEGPGSVNPAWSPQLGAGVTVGVIDTGITDHPDLAGQTVAGYDFVSNPAGLAAPREPGGGNVAFDGDDQPGWDADPTDPGDWRGVAPVRASTWHGTHIAGIIAARAANGEGITGLAPGAKIQPVRAISWRGGLLSDITAAITWTSGGDVPGVPANATPSKVVNLSFTLASPCTPALQAAITGANSRGSVVIAAAGNANDDVAGYAPANCEGTIAVAATDRDGKRAPYSNYGTGIDLAAPGGSLNGNTGVLSASNPGYATREGTSIAAAHVTAIATRIVAANPDATPNDIRNQLTTRQAVRPFPNNTCDPDTTKTCGTGIAAFAQVSSVPVMGDWELQSSPADSDWTAVAYGAPSDGPYKGQGIYVAVARSSSVSGLRIMTSVDAKVWTIQRVSFDLALNLVESGLSSVTYADGRFIIGSEMSGMTGVTSDGINWTKVSGLSGRQRISWAYGTPRSATDPVFVGVGSFLLTNLKSNLTYGGETFSTRPSRAQWSSVIFGNGRFVAVASSTYSDHSPTERIVYSDNGSSWTLVNSPNTNAWQSITFGKGRCGPTSAVVDCFVAVSSDGLGNRVMTSPDGAVWTERSTPPAADLDWRSVTYGDGHFVAVASSGTGSRVMVSSDAVTWNLMPTPADNNWRGVAYGNGVFVAVASSGVGNRLMTSGISPSQPLISTASGIANAAVNPSVVIASTTPFAASLTPGNFDLQSEGKALALTQVVRQSSTRVRLEFSGTAGVDSLDIAARPGAFAQQGLATSNVLSIDVGPPASKACPESFTWVPGTSDVCERVFTETQVWTLPEGLATFDALLVGGGGGGGGGSTGGWTTGGFGKGGGGGGGGAIVRVANVSASSPSLNITVGAAGLGGAGASATTNAWTGGGAGTAGGNSSISDGSGVVADAADTPATAAGGAGGSAATSSTSSGGNGGTGGGGGLGSVGGARLSNWIVLAGNSPGGGGGGGADNNNSSRVQSGGWGAISAIPNGGLFANFTDSLGSGGGGGGGTLQLPATVIVSSASGPGGGAGGLGAEGAGNGGATVIRGLAFAGTNATSYGGGGGGGGAATRGNPPSVRAGDGGSGFSGLVIVRTRASELLAGLTPVLTSPVQMAAGYTFQVSNFDPAYTWSVTSTAGTAAINGSGVVTVTGLSAGQSATVTVSTSRTGYANGSASISGSALPATSGDGGGGAQGASETSGANGRRPVNGGGPPPAIQDLTVRRPGSALVRVTSENGDPSRGQLPVVVAPLPGRDGKVIRASSWDVELQGVEESGSPAPLNASGNLEVVQGRGLATSGRGFAPGSAVGVYLFSEPRTLGTLTTDARGVFSGVVPVPGDVPVGVHTAQVSGYTPDGDILIVSLGIEVAARQVDPLVNPVPSRVQPLWWVPVTDASGEVVVSAGSSGCSAVDGDGSPARGRSLVFWNTGTCIFEVRSGGKTWKKYRVPIVVNALKTEGVQELATRKVWFTSSGGVRGKSAQMLAAAVPRMQSSPASYAFWVDSKGTASQASTTRQHAALAKQLNALGPVRGIRTITPTKPWAATFPPNTSNYILIAWKP